MKTAVSIPDATFQAGEQVAKRLGVSRSELYARAVLQYVAAHDEGDVTQALNRVYADGDAGVDPILSKLQRKSLPPDSW